MKFIDLKSQYKLIEKDVNQRIKKVLEHGQYINGPEVQELEECLSNYVGVRNCIGLSSGTDALLVAMMALNIGNGDEVITTPFTFIATGETIALLGAKPVFVDIDPHTYNIDPDHIEDAITPKTKAIMPVSLYGQCADFDTINKIAKKHNLAVIEDGAQSFGATYKGEKSCGLTDIGCTSFFPAKPLGAYGDAGACFTNDDTLAKVMREIRNHGQDRRYHHVHVGINGRIDTIQAAVLLAKMQIFPKEVENRSDIGTRYSDLFSGTDDIVTPYIAPYNTSVYAQYSIQVKLREKVQEKLKANDIPFAVHYPIPLPQQPIFEQYNTGFPVSEALAKKVISLPMHPLLSPEDQALIVQTIK